MSEGQEGGLGLIYIDVIEFHANGPLPDQQVVLLCMRDSAVQGPVEVWAMLVTVTRVKKRAVVKRRGLLKAIIAGKQGAVGIALRKYVLSAWCAQGW